MTVAEMVDVYHATCFESGQMEEPIQFRHNKANAIPTFDWKNLREAEKHKDVRSLVKCLPNSFHTHSVVVVLVRILSVVFQNNFM
jgi:hypothetical protein